MSSHLPPRNDSSNSLQSDTTASTTTRPSSPNSVPLLLKLSDKIVESKRMITDAFEHTIRNPSSVSVAFNGGKESVVVLYLLKEAIGLDALQRMVLIVSDEADEFPEVVQFRDETIAQLGLTLEKLPEPLATGLWKVYKERNVEFVFGGIRRDDQGWPSTPIAKCSGAYPPMTVYSPVFEWTYSDIWDFIKDSAAPKPYCILYDKGYTSLGPKNRTLRNPCLRVGNSDEYRPAWELRDSTKERAGRTPRQPNNAPDSDSTKPNTVMPKKGSQL